MLPFWISIGALSLVQGALVAVPGSGGLGALRRLRGRRWALIPPLSVIGFVFLARGAEQASAQGLTYLALVAVPLLAALALGWLAWNAHPPRPARALLVAPLFALAWADRTGLPGVRGRARPRARGRRRAVLLRDLCVRDERKTDLPLMALVVSLHEGREERAGLGSGP